jgi:hypothetical protein
VISETSVGTTGGDFRNRHNASTIICRATSYPMRTVPRSAGKCPGLGRGRL